MSDPAAVAAFVAAGLSLVNVGITARLASRGQREQWRRAEERPIVARCLTLSGEALIEWRRKSEMTDASPDPDADPETLLLGPQWEKATRLLDEFRYEAAQLDLLASTPVRRAVRNLYDAHTTEAARLMKVALGRDTGGNADQARIGELEDALIDAARTDLGLGPAINPPPGSLLGKLLSSRNGP